MENVKKIVILGCENSHANQFLEFIKNEPNYSNVEVVGVYSDESEAATALAEKYGVKVMNAYDEAVGQVDGVVITARHGGMHYKFAKPYLKSGVPMFIDKPITISEEEGLELMREARANGVRLTGGSTCKHDPFIQELKEDVKNEYDGKTLGGFVRCPLESDERYGGFFFYAQHMTEIVGEIFGRYPKSVTARQNGEKTSVIFRYDDYDVFGLFVEMEFSYFVSRCSQTEVKAKSVPEVDWTPCFRVEFEEFYQLLCGSEQMMSYEDILAPVFTMNAIYRAIESQKEENVKTFEI